MADYRQFSRRPIRLVGYDYRSEGLYFVTICTKDRVCSLGDVVHGEMILSDMGIVVYDYWCEIDSLYPHVHLGEFVVMPNHIHGILHLTTEETVAALHRNAVVRNAIPPSNADARNPITPRNADARNAITPSKAAAHNSIPKKNIDNNPGRDKQINTHMSDLSPKSGSISRILGQYKTACTRMINSICTDTFAWQPRFHDRIIRSEAELRNVEAYIMNNPKNWSEDVFF